MRFTWGFGDVAPVDVSEVQDALTWEAGPLDRIRTGSGGSLLEPVVPAQQPDFTAPDNVPVPPPAPTLPSAPLAAPAITEVLSFDADGQAVFTATAAPLLDLPGLNETYDLDTRAPGAETGADLGQIYASVSEDYAFLSMGEPWQYLVVLGLDASLTGGEFIF